VLGDVIVSFMRTSDVICPECGAGYRRLELATRPGKTGEFRCLVCDQVLELFDGSHEVAIRLTVQPSKLRDAAEKRFSN
jgi:transposase-like protein